MFTDPNQASIASAHLGLEVGDFALGLHFFKEFFAPVRVDVNLSANARHRVNEIRRLSVAVKARERRISREIASVGCRLENAFAGILKDAPVFVFRRAGGDQRFVGTLSGGTQFPSRCGQPAIDECEDENQQNQADYVKIVRLDLHPVPKDEIPKNRRKNESCGEHRPIRELHQRKGFRGLR